MIVPTSIRLLLGVAVLGVTGAALTLAHPSQSPDTNTASRSTSADLSATANTQPAAQDVVENPSMSISVDGQSVPARNGTTQVPTKSGTATVNVSGGNVNVSRNQSAASPQAPSSLDVSIRSNTTNGSNVSSFSHSHTSSSSSTFSQVMVSGSGSAQVHTSTQP